LRKKRILISEDDEDVSVVFQEILQAAGYHADIVDTAKQTVAQITDKFYHVIILDIKLPDMDGTELLTSIREIAPEIIVIIVTGYPSLNNAIDALNWGADSYIVKPVDPNELLSIVSEKLKQQDEASNMSEEKVAQWIKTRIKQRETEEDSFTHMLRK
jgi:DNA-binding response OmpR family regulator